MHLRQYQFPVFVGHKSGTVYCTAPSATIAVTAVRRSFSAHIYRIGEAEAVHAPHRFCTELDASSEELIHQ